MARARSVRREAVERAERRGTDRDVAEQLCWDTPTAWTIRPAGALELDLVERIEHALSVVEPEDRELRARLLSSLVLETESSPLIPRAEQAAAEARALARELGDAGLVCQALNATYLLTSPPRPPAGQRQVGEELLTAAREAGLVGYEAVAHHILFGAAAGEGDLGGAQAQVDLAVRCAEAGQLPALLGVSALLGGVSRLVTGDVDGAESTYAGVARAMDAAHDANAAGIQLLLRFCIAHARGDTSALRDAVRSLVGAGQIPVRDLAVRAALDAGDVDRARALASDLPPLHHSYLWDLFSAVRAQNAADLGDVAQCRASHDELTPFAGRFAGLSSGAMTLGPVDYFLGRTAAALAEPDSARRHLRAAQELAARYGNTAWTSQAQCALHQLVAA